MCKVVRARKTYNHRSDKKSFVQRQVELTELQGRHVDRVELLKETHANSSGEFISLAAEDAFVSFRKVYVWLYFNYSMLLILTISQTYYKLLLCRIRRWILVLAHPRGF